MGSLRRLLYDRRGNLASVSKGGAFQKSFRFDAANRMVSAATAGGGTAAYTYDGLGRRVKSVWDKVAVAGNEARHEERRYILDALKPYENVLMAYGTDGAARHVWGNELVSAGADPAYYLHDELRSPVRMMDADGGSLSRFDYDEFGVPILAESSCSVGGEEPFSANQFGFTGYQPDPVTGLNYAQARYYIPQTGRFVSEDSYKGVTSDISSLNYFAYCNNNPLRFIDPSGLAGISAPNIPSPFDVSNTLEYKRAEALMPSTKQGLADLNNIWDQNIVGSERINVTGIMNEKDYVTTVHVGGDIFVSTKTINAQTGDKTTGWKINSPTITIGPIEYSSGLEWTGNSLGYNVSAHDTLSKGVIEMGSFYNNYGSNISLAAGQKTGIMNGPSVSGMTRYSKHVMSYGEYAALAAVVTIVVISAPVIIGGEAVSFGGATPGIAAGVSALVTVFGLNDFFKGIGDDFAKIKTDYMD